MAFHKKKGDLFEGLIQQTFNRFYTVQVGSHDYLCQPKGILRQNEDPNYRLPVIGDWVTIELTAESREGVDGYIVGIRERRNALARFSDQKVSTKLMAANLDAVIVVSSVLRPDCDFGLIDRYLVACTLQGLPAIVVINKIELDPEFLNRPELKVYRDLGYPVIETSVKKDIGMDQLRAVLSSGVSFFTGTSGVGKSSLINTLVPKAQLAVGKVAERGGTGKHTTTSSILLPVGSGYLADSPGLRDYYPPRVEPEQVRFGFIEIQEDQKDCRYASCCHIQEPDCAIRESVRLGRIADWRYKNYRDLYFEMKNWQNQRYH